jgi:hypothetical protein
MVHLPRRLPAILALTVACLVPASARAAGVAYLDGHEVWVSTLDGSKKVRLSGGEGDWNSVAQADNGRVVGVRNEPGKISTLSTFTVWLPDGSVFNSGPLPGESGWQIYSYPVSLDLTADGGLVVYGYSNSRYVNSYQFDFGFYSVPATTQTLTQPYKVSGMEFPTVNGTRVIARPQGAETEAHVQRAAGSPVTTEFDPWLYLDPTVIPNTKFRRTDVAANSRVVGLELAESTGPSTDNLSVAMIQAPGLGQAPTATDSQNSCLLPGTNVTGVSLLQDASLVAYKDDGGAKVAGVPTFSGVDTCVLSSPAVTISPTGSSPSLGPIDADALYAARNPVAPPVTPPLPGGGAGPLTPGAGNGLSVVLAKGAKAAALGKRTGLPVVVTVPRAGLVTVTLKVAASKLKRKGKPIVIATGKATAKKAGKLTVRLKATKVARKKLRRLRGAKVTLTVKVGTLVSSAVVRLK